MEEKPRRALEIYRNEGFKPLVHKTAKYFASQLPPAWKVQTRRIIDTLRSGHRWPAPQNKFVFVETRQLRIPDLERDLRVIEKPVHPGDWDTSMPLTQSEPLPIRQDSFSGDQSISSTLDNIDDDRLLLTSEDIHKKAKSIDRLLDNLPTTPLFEATINNNNTSSLNVTAIVVNIDRRGRFVINGDPDSLLLARLALALDLEYVPVCIHLRHQKWQEFRDTIHRNMISGSGHTYNILPHPDLQEVPTLYDSTERAELIHENIETNQGRLVDVGAKYGALSQYFEQAGFDVYAIEYEQDRVYLMQKLKEASDRDFEIIDKSVFEYPIADLNADVILCLNVFHHFLNDEMFDSMLELLGSLNSAEFYVQSHEPGNGIPDERYGHYVEDKLIELILDHSHYTSSKLLGRPGGHKERALYKLSDD